VSVSAARVERWLARTQPSADIVVLDPPRKGAGRAVIDGIAAAGPRRVVHVACDPASLARDVALLAGHGYALDGLRAFDLFPMTAHVECVATLVRADRS
jgi:tRNA/tmRNA/rRNA uracil-C5-methylase (TrmA/RlmC/RlmD family)